MVDVLKQTLENGRLEVWKLDAIPEQIAPHILEINSQFEEPYESRVYLLGSVAANVDSGIRVTAKRDKNTGLITSIISGKFQQTQTREVIAVRTGLSEEEFREIAAVFDRLADLNILQKPAVTIADEWNSYTSGQSTTNQL